MPAANWQWLVEILLLLSIKAALPIVIALGQECLPVAGSSPRLKQSLSTSPARVLFGEGTCRE